MKLSLYFIALVIEGETGEQITAFKDEMASLYRVRHALKSPPHVTLISPLRATDTQIETAKNLLSKIASTSTNFTIVMDGFDSFDSRVIFVNVLHSPILEELKYELEEELYKYEIVKEKEKRKFHPHVTIAHRDLTRKKYEQSWPDFKNRKFRKEVKTTRISLLRHQNRRWVVSDHFALGSQQGLNHVKVG